jgi:hypothetical protein
MVAPRPTLPTGTGVIPAARVYLVPLHYRTCALLILVGQSASRLPAVLHTAMLQCQPSAPLPPALVESCPLGLVLVLLTGIFRVGSYIIWDGWFVIECWWVVLL